MFFKTLIDLLFLPLKGLVALLPQGLAVKMSNVNVPLPIKYGSWFFPMDLGLLVVNGFMLWFVVFIGWAVIEWVYKKIPGVS